MNVVRELGGMVHHMTKQSYVHCTMNNLYIVNQLTGLHELLRMLRMLTNSFLSTSRQRLRCEPAIWPWQWGFGLGLGLGLRARVHFPSMHGCTL